ncbi:MAG: bifunctional diguanylate cyclase/phosphodiesterase [Gammaproteobacteria bacterium]|nr:bifunctional diguanylate cyclase/phosphodiesterase [Gammaproteobacteria bacterium]
MKRRLQNLLPLPISAYLGGFFSVSLLLFIIIGGWMLLQMNKVTNAAEASRSHSARTEVQAAIDKVLTSSHEMLAELSQWDETRQQLQDDTYYEYWRNTRVLQTSRIPHYVTDVDIYDLQGAILLARSGSSMPDKLPDSLNFIDIQQGTTYLYRFMPIVRPGDGQRNIGYVGLRMNFDQALQELNHFIYTDSNSLGIVSPEGARFPPDEIQHQLSYLPRQSGETRELESMMRSTLYSFAALAVVLIIISYYLTSSLLHTPLRRLAQYIEELRRNRGDISKTELSGGTLCVKEFDMLRSSIIDYQHELEEMHNHLDQKNREMWRLAHHDALTGIANRRAYDEDWERLQELVRGQRIQVSVMLIDCDHFKAINDTYGHDVGDQVIRVIADSLRQDLREGDHLYRLGGDEFAVHLINTDAEQCRTLAQRYQERLSHFDFKALGIKEPVRFSIGIATAEGSQLKQVAQLHKRADIAMYQAKRPGNNKIAVYNDGMAGNAESLLSNRFITAVYQAIEQGDHIELHYQPVLAADDAQSGFYETLVRLRDERGTITPHNIFPVVESEGLAVEFDYAVFRRITKAFEQGEIPQGTCISLNVDGSTLMHHNFIQQVSRLAPFIQSGCRCIVLEITENALISEIEEGSRKLRHLREAGFAIALDDFGSGYSSLRYLANMPVDIIKLDIGMVRDLEGDPSQRIITEHIAHMVRGAGYQLVAEGIENDSLLYRVLALGFTHVQGFLFDHSLPAIDPQNRLTVAEYPRNSGKSLNRALGS